MNVNTYEYVQGPEIFRGRGCSRVSNGQLVRLQNLLSDQGSVSRARRAEILCKQPSLRTVSKNDRGSGFVKTSSRVEVNGGTKSISDYFLLDEFDVTWVGVELGRLWIDRETPG